jgi:putative transposase
LYKTIQVKLNVSESVIVFLSHQGHAANSLINSAHYLIRQKHYESCPRVEFFDKDDFYRNCFKIKSIKDAGYATLCTLMKSSIHYQILGGQCAQQTLKSVAEQYNSYNKLLPLWFSGEVSKPELPKYRKSGGVAGFTYPAQAVLLDIETGMCRLPISRELKSSIQSEFGLKEIWINGATGFKASELVEVRIVPRNNTWYAEYVYQTGNSGATCNLNLDHTQAMGIDPGSARNWLTCVTTQGKSFIIDVKKIKSSNQWYNKQVATIKFGKPQGFWNDKLAEITEKRNRQMRDAINKAARFIINNCLSNKIGNVVFGWNQGHKDSSNMGQRNNQAHVQLPTAKLKERIKQLCEEYGIQFHETEESYTSQSSFLDNDELPKYGVREACRLGEKPKEWKPSGQRIERGLYKTKKGFLINADCNAAANILKKVAKQLGISLAKLGRAALTLPHRYDLFQNLKKTFRNSLRSVALAHEATSF